MRTPIIPGVNDTVDEVDAIAGFVARLPNLLYYELLPYHPMAKSKYRSLDLPCAGEELSPPSKETMAALADVAAARDVAVRIG